MSQSGNTDITGDDCMDLMDVIESRVGRKIYRHSWSRELSIPEDIDDMRVAALSAPKRLAYWEAQKTFAWLRLQAAEAEWNKAEAVFAISIRQSLSAAQGNFVSDKQVAHYAATSSELVGPRQAWEATKFEYDQIYAMVAGQRARVSVITERLKR